MRELSFASTTFSCFFRKWNCFHLGASKQQYTKQITSISIKRMKTYSNPFYIFFSLFHSCLVGWFCAVIDTCKRGSTVILSFQTQFSTNRQWNERSNIAFSMEKIGLKSEVGKLVMKAFDKDFDIFHSSRWNLIRWLPLPVDTNDE